MTKSLILSFVFVSIIFLIIDVLWLSITVRILYKPALGNLINDKPVMWAAILFYVIYMIGLTLIIIKPAINNDSIFQALWTGTVFGIVAYGTYNLTNMATIRDWSPNIVWIDMLWGGILSGFSSALSIYLVFTFFSIK
tara:strand:- start:61 stop:474 length:414 start_codon:yes stop_codon:yes gene_type:complete